MMFEDLLPFLDNGVAVFVLAWFMFRAEKVLTRVTKTMALLTTAMIRVIDRQDAEIADKLSEDLSRINGD